MTTRQTIDDYLAALGSGGDWQRFLDPDLSFASRVGIPKETTGRDAYLASTARFFAMARGVEPVRVLVDGDQAATLSTYALRAPDGSAFTSDVAEFLTVRDGRIVELAICFDTAPYPVPQPASAR